MLINCAAYQDGTKLADCPIDDISEYLLRPGCFVWVVLKDATPEELSTMQEEFGLHDLAVEDARHGHQRPKIEECGDTVFAVLHTVEMQATDELLVGEVDIVVGHNFVLSARNRTQQGFLGVRARAEREPHLLRHGRRRDVMAAAVATQLSGGDASWRAARFASDLRRRARSALALDMK